MEVIGNKFQQLNCTKGESKGVGHTIGYGEDNCPFIQIRYRKE
jgi:hypothetical protein